MDDRTTVSIRVVQRQAAAVLALLGPAAENAIPELRSALQSKQEIVVAHAASALGAIGPAAKSAVPELQQLLR